MYTHLSAGLLPPHKSNHTAVTSRRSYCQTVPLQRSSLRRSFAPEFTALQAGIARKKLRLEVSLSLVSQYDRCDQRYRRHVTGNQEGEQYGLNGDSCLREHTMFFLMIVSRLSKVAIRLPSPPTAVGFVSAFDSEFRSSGEHRMSAPFTTRSVCAAVSRSSRDFADCRNSDIHWDGQSQSVLEVGLRFSKIALQVLI